MKKKKLFFIIKYMANTKNSVDLGGRNTKGVVRSRCWGPNTWNNYNESDINNLLGFCERKNIVDYIIQEEIGKNSKTQHLQFSIRFKNQVSLDTLKNFFDKVHWEKSKNIFAAFKYCAKDDTHIGRRWKKKRFNCKDPLENLKYYKWQEDILKLISKSCNVKNRKIHWYYDEIGGCGKTMFAKHIILNYENSCYCNAGKANDIKFYVSSVLKTNNNKLNVCIFDFARSNENYISYQAIEEIKNGIMFCGKYESGLCLFDTPHIIIFANFKPDETKLSMDRWIIKEL